MCSHSSWVFLVFWVSGCSPLDSCHLYLASEASQTGQSARVLPVLSRAERFLLIWSDIFLQLEGEFSLQYHDGDTCSALIMTLRTFSSDCCSCSVQCSWHFSSCGTLQFSGLSEVFWFLLVSSNMTTLSLCNKPPVCSPQLPVRILNRTGPLTAVCCSSCCYLL